MKKILSIVLSLVCALTLLTACGQKSDTPTTGSSGAAPSVSSEAKKATPVYPTKNVEFIIPYAAGGGTDALMRLMAAEIEKEWGKSLVITNRDGNLGQIGLTELSKKPNDGYTLGALSNLDHILVLLTGENVEYTYEDFEYIGAINTTANVLFASAQSGFKSLEEMIAFGKENPGKLTVAISGKTHIAEAALIEKATGIKVTTIMQGGGGESLNALLGGHVDLAIMDKKFVEQIDGQNCSALAVLSGERMDVISEIPTMKEQGYDVATETYRVITAPKGTPQEVIDAVSATMKKVTDTEDFKQKMTDMSEIYRFLSPAEVKERLDSDMENMKALVAENPDAF